MTNKEHGEEFLKYVADNMDRLKHNLRKNITYDPDIFEDSFQDSIIRVYNAIMNGSRIEDFEQYFYIASKFDYITKDNKKKNRLKQDDGDILSDISHGVIDDIFYNESDWKSKEEKSDKINILFKFLSERLNEVFSPVECDIFLIYYRLKSEKAGVSYKKMASITDKSVQEITNTIKTIKKFIKNDKIIQDKKKELLR